MVFCSVSRAMIGTTSRKFLIQTDSDDMNSQDIFFIGGHVMRLCRGVLFVFLAIVSSLKHRDGLDSQRRQYS